MHDSLIFDLLYDEERARATRAAGPHGVRVYPRGNPESPFRFEIFGFPGQDEAIKAADREIRRRLRLQRSH